MVTYDLIELVHLRSRAYPPSGAKQSVASEPHIQQASCRFQGKAREEPCESGRMGNRGYATCRIRWVSFRQSIGTSLGCSCVAREIATVY